MLYMAILKGSVPLQRHQHATLVQYHSAIMNILKKACKGKFITIIHISVLYATPRSNPLRDAIHNPGEGYSTHVQTSN